MSTFFEIFIGIVIGNIIGEIIVRWLRGDD